MNQVNPTITIDKSFGMYILKNSGIKTSCHFCRTEITENNFGGLFDKDKVSCSNLPCIMKLSDILETKSEMTEQSDKLKAEIFDKVREYYLLAHKKDEFVAGKTRVDYAGRVYDEKEMINLVDSALEFWLSAGRYAKKFEDGLAKFIGVKHCMLTNSGSSANLLAISSLCSPELVDRRLMTGDEVITVACGFPTTIAPIIQNGLVPVFVDVEIPSYNIDCSMLEKALSDKSKAVFLAHTLGNPFDVDTVRRFCEENGLWLIEDACDALGSKYNGKMVGGFGDISTNSFYLAHHIGCGEGGAICTDSTELKDIICSLRDWGRDCICGGGQDNVCGNRFKMRLGELPYGYDHKYTYSHFGYNLKATDMQAAILCAQLEKLPMFIEKRKRNFEALSKLLGKYSDKLIFPEASAGSNPSWFAFMICVREWVGFSKDDLVRFLESKKIQTRGLFAGNIVRHPCFDEIRGSDKYRVVGDLRNSDFVMENGFFIGVYPGMTDEKIEYIGKCFDEFFTYR